MLLSTFASARRTLSLPIIVALLNTDTFAEGQSLSRKAIVSSIIASKSGCIVGSPLPAKVITSGGVDVATISLRTSSRRDETSSRVLNRRDVEFSAFQPHSQYIQSKLHSLELVGSRFIPKLKPKRRERIGPKMMFSNNAVIVIQR
jgi:hypothetical protein